MSTYQFINKIKQYVGKHVEVRYYHVKYPKIVEGVLEEVTNEYITVRDDFDRDVVIRLPWIVSIAISKEKPVEKWLKKDEENMSIGLIS